MSFYDQQGIEGRKGHVNFLNLQDIKNDAYIPLANGSSCDACLFPAPLSLFDLRCADTFEHSIPSEWDPYRCVFL